MSDVTEEISLTAGEDYISTSKLPIITFRFYFCQGNLFHDTFRQMPDTWLWNLEWTLWSASVTFCCAKHLALVPILKSALLDLAAF